MTWQAIAVTADHLKFAVVFLAWGIVCGMVFFHEREKERNKNDDD